MFLEQRMQDILSSLVKTRKIENLVRELVFYFHVRCLKGVNVK